MVPTVTFCITSQVCIPTDECPVNFEPLYFEFAGNNFKHVRRAQIIAWSQKPIFYIYV